MTENGKKERFEKKLKVYSAAAAGVLAITPAAEAAIHYSGLQNLPVSSSQSQTIDMNNDSTNDFGFGYWVSQSRWYWVGIRDMGSAEHIKGTSTAGNRYYLNDALNLPSNYQIGPNLTNFPRAQWNQEYGDTLNGSFDSGDTYDMGNFNNTTGYIGVRFHTEACQGTNYAYGWFHYTGYTGSGGNNSGTIIDWAYEDVCNQPILAGQTESNDIPTMSQWGMIVFALLLGGIAARRLRKLGKEEG